MHATMPEISRLEMQIVPMKLYFLHFMNISDDFNFFNDAAAQIAHVAYEAAGGILRDPIGRYVIEVLAAQGTRPIH